MVDSNSASNIIDTLDDESELIDEYMDEEIEETMVDTRAKLLEHFNSDVHSRLKVQLDKSKKQISRVASAFWALTKHELKEYATFDNEQSIFTLKEKQFLNIHLGRYQLISNKTKIKNTHTCRINSELGESVVKQVKERRLELSELTFCLSYHRANISALKPYIGKSSCMTLTKLKIHSFEDEEYLIASAITDSGDKLENEVALKLFEVNASTQVPNQTNSLQNEIQKYKQQQIKQATQNSEEKNGEYFNAEIEKLEKWADDQLLSAEKELKELRKEINRERTQSKTAPTQQKLKIQMDIRNLEKKQHRLKREMEEAEDIIFAKRSEIIDTLEESLNQSMNEEKLFTRWRII